MLDRLFASQQLIERVVPLFKLTLLDLHPRKEARERNPRRWSGWTRNWTPVTAVTLNPERDMLIQAATPQIQLSGSIGEPAFPSRPGSVETMARNGGDGRSGATRSHAQCALPREHGEDGEHQTFSEVSAVAHSSPADRMPSRHCRH